MHGGFLSYTNQVFILLLLSFSSDYIIEDEILCTWVFRVMSTKFLYKILLKF